MSDSPGPCSFEPPIDLQTRTRTNPFETVTFSTDLFRAVALLCAAAPALVAQVAPSPRFLDVGSERERVLRVLQLTGDVPLYPWSLRGFSPGEIDRLGVTTARGRALLPPESAVRTLGALRFEVLPVEAGLIYNSTFPYGFNDGPVWAGRGLTGSLSGGVAGRIGPLSFQLEPMLFEAQNQSFELKPNDAPGNPYLDGFYPGQIDLPQRFGDKAYGRFDLGQSSVRLDVGPLAAELSTADQWWGPAIESPLILGNNAPGFPHLALGTSHPVDIWIGQIHGRVVWGRLAQSSYSPDHGADSLRFMSGVVGVFVPRGVPGLEIGASRFFHTEWPANGLSHAPFGRPFEGILKKQLATTADPTGTSPDNQLASVFARWAFPQAGFEVYGEFGREDHNIDLRDFWQELDHDAAYLFGLQRVWKRKNDAFVATRFEVLNTRLSHLDQGRGQAPWYTHDGSVAQGHTVLGQALAAAGGYGGGQASAAVDLYDSSGRWTFEWNRLTRSESDLKGGTGLGIGADVLQSLTVERQRMVGSISLFAAGSAAWDLNRDFAHDRFNLNVRTGVRSAF